MQLSILLPTHRHDLLASSRIAQACSFAGPEVEVIIRDNSGNPQKRDLLGLFHQDNCNIVLADPCEPLENFSELLRMAKGEFVLSIADDDYCFDRAIEALPALLAQAGADRSVTGVTGHYALETSTGSAIVSYDGVDSADVLERVTGYLTFSGPNVLTYAPQRLQLVRRVFVFMRSMPFYFSFHDQILCLLYLCNGRYARLPRMFYLYDVGLWEARETAQSRDLDFYRAAGLDPSINKLHWFLCGFEGAALLRHSDIVPELSPEQRQAISDLWSATMFVRFKHQPSLTFGSPYADAAEAACVRLKASPAPPPLEAMLTEICSVMALSSQSHAQRYFEFWNGLINKRHAISKTVR